MKKGLSIRRLVSFLLGIAFVIFMIFYIKDNLDVFSHLKYVSFEILFLVFVANLILIYINGIFLKIIVEPFNIDLKEPFLLSLGSSFFNLIFPFRAGAGVRALYMKRKYNLGYGHFSASLFGNYVISFFLSSFVAILLSVFIYFQFGIFNLPISLIFLGIFAFCVLVLCNFPFKLSCEGKAGRIVNSIVKGWTMIKSNPKTIVNLVFNNLIAMIVGVLMTWLVFLSIDFKISIFQVTYFAVMGVLATFVNITPGSLGVTEGLFAISAQVLGIPPAVGVLAALVVRLVNTMLLLVFGPIANYLLYKKI